MHFPLPLASDRVSARVGVRGEPQAGRWLQLTEQTARIWLWLLAFACLFGAFAPTLSKYLDAKSNPAWVEVCTATGTQRISLETGLPLDSGEPAYKAEHCGYCLLQEHSPALTSTESHWTPSITTGQQLRIGSGNTTIPKRFLREAHQTRAPPALS
nr:DUF2946 domain-containing protein [uncultured Rhodoferax sp.]